MLNNIGSAWQGNTKKHQEQITRKCQKNQEHTLRGRKKTIEPHNKEVPKNTKMHNKEATNSIRNAQQGGAKEH